MKAAGQQNIPLKVRVPERLYQYVLLMRWHRPIGFLLLLWPTLWALWVAAGGFPDIKVLLVFVLGVFLMRSAGCVINDVADRNFDSQVSRTRERPIASGRVSVREALTLFAVLCLLAFALVLTLNRMTLYLSLVALLLAAMYPLMKRFTHMPQVVLGMAFGWAIPMAFAAQTSSIPKIAWLMFVVNIVWTVVYDTMYAMADREDDLKAGVKSTAILFGEGDRVILAMLQLMMLAGMWLMGLQLQAGFAYYLSLLFVVGLSVYQQYLIRRREPAACLDAFLNNNWLGCALFLGIAFHYL